jgi:hypothetical protein
VGQLVGWVGVFQAVDAHRIGRIERLGEPVNVLVNFRDDQLADLARELRVARVDRKTGMLREIPSQLYDEAYRNGSRTARIVFLADVAANGQAQYLIFYGNPAAELPSYPTDLNVRGEGVGLDIENRHYRARMSRQMGQLERLTYRRSRKQYRCFDVRRKKQPCEMAGELRTSSSTSLRDSST